MKHTILIILWVPLIVAETKYSQEFFSNIINSTRDAITYKCHEQFEEFISDLNTRKKWSQQMIDATSDIPMGPAPLKFNNLGDFEECVNIQTSTETGDLLGKYCLGSILTNNETHTSIDLLLKRVWALCLPNGCTSDDTNIIGSTILSNLLEREKIHIVFEDFLCQTIENVRAELSYGAMGTIIFLSSLLLIVLLSTFYDSYCNTKCPRLIKGFSIYTNSKTIFKMGKPNTDHLPCLGGLRWLSMMWVIIVHQYYSLRYGPFANPEYVRDWFTSPIATFVGGGSFAVDSFLTIGGTLVSYCFMKARHNEKHFNIFWYYLHRYIRLTPSFSVMVLVSATLLSYTNSGPEWPVPIKTDVNTCQTYWWSSLLYIQNYVNPRQLCIGATWYLNVDMQLYVISPILLFALWKFPKKGLLLIGSCGFLLMVLSSYQVWSNELIVIGVSIRNEKYFVKYHQLTHTRAVPWIIGIILGFYIFKIKEKSIVLKLNKYTVVFYWFLSVGTMIMCIFISSEIFTTDGVTLNLLHAALVRPAWSLAIAWLIFACINNYGGPVNFVLSLPIFQVLNRFLYSVYLVHSAVLLHVTFTRRLPEYFADFDKAYQFWGTLCFCLGFGALLVFMVECPAVAIERELYEKAFK